MGEKRRRWEGSQVRKKSTRKVVNGRRGGVELHRTEQSTVDSEKVYFLGFLPVIVHNIMTLDSKQKAGYIHTIEVPKRNDFQPSPIQTNISFREDGRTPMSPQRAAQCSVDPWIIDMTLKNRRKWTECNTKCEMRDARKATSRPDRTDPQTMATFRRIFSLVQ